MTEFPSEMSFRSHTFARRSYIYIHKVYGHQVSLALCTKILNAKVTCNHLQMCSVFVSSLKLHRRPVSRLWGAFCFQKRQRVYLEFVLILLKENLCIQDEGIVDFLFAVTFKYSINTC